MLTKPGTYYISQPYPGNTQITIMDFDSVSTILVVENRKLNYTLYILSALGYEHDERAQSAWRVPIA